MIPSHLVADAARRQVIDAAITLAVGDIYDAQAFAALLRAVDVHREAHRRRVAEPSPVVPFGHHQGKPVSALTTSELQRLEQYVTGAIHNAQKAKFRPANLTLRAAVIAELHSRTTKETACLSSNC